MNRLPSTTKLLHAEVVLRSDLRGKYQAMRRKIQQTATRRLSDRRKQDAAWDELGKEEIVFHGTPRHNVGSIVRSGFIVPGEKTVEGTKVEVRCGSTWGRTIAQAGSKGIVDFCLGKNLYVLESPSSFCPQFTDTGPYHKIVCAVLMGRRRFMTESYRRRATLEEGYDSHVSPSKSEYIVFNSAQVLPLYVLHLGESRDASGLDPLPLTATSKTSFEGNLTDYARKHLPNGFGAASGHRFMVLEIAPIDDDEELWGDYQHTNDHEEGEFQNERWNYWTGYSIG
ncbi:hypothetical protein H0H87_000207 [Tephrocybe sp. NHM501043]|nr:hypothetical protein H0H87_000207 [Tephrocybe sp. NHM501043]